MRISGNVLNLQIRLSKKDEAFFHEKIFFIFLILTGFLLK